MKKTLFSMLLAGLTSFAVSAADGDSLTTTNVNLTATQSSGNYAALYGFKTALNSTIFTRTDADDEHATTVNLAQKVTLNSIACVGRSTSDNNAPSLGTLVKIAVYSDNAGALGSLVALSDATAYAYGSDRPSMTYTFSDVQLESATTYWYMFVNGSATKETLESDGYTSNSIKMGASVLPSTDGSALTKSNSGTGILSTESYFLAMTISTTAVETPAVPEPATATLSLLALAGLAARRRRK